MRAALLLGALLANVALRKNFHVPWLSSYGPESRGGIANRNVVVSDQPAASPIVTEPSVLMALNGPSLERFESSVTGGGVVVYNSALIPLPPCRSSW